MRQVLRSMASIFSIPTHFRKVQIFKRWPKMNLRQWDFMHFFRIPCICVCIMLWKCVCSGVAHECLYLINLMMLPRMRGPWKRPTHIKHIWKENLKWENHQTDSLCKKKVLPLCIYYIWNARIMKRENRVVKSPKKKWGCKEMASSRCVEDTHRKTKFIKKLLRNTEMQKRKQISMR